MNILEWIEKRYIQCFGFFSMMNTSRIALLGSIIVSFFIVILYYGYDSLEISTLTVLNYLKYPIIIFLAFVFYEFYKTKSDYLLFPIIIALIITWFADFDAPYRWDAIQHVARAKFYMNQDIIAYFSSNDRISYVYLLWGFLYRLFGEYEVVTNLSNMIIGLTGIFGIFVVAKDIFGKNIALPTIIISLSLPLFFLVNKWAYLDMIFMAFVVFSMLFLIKFVKKTKISFLWLSLIFALLSTGMKDPGIVLFVIITLVIFKSKLVTKLTLSSILIFFFGGILSILNTLRFFTPFIGSSGEKFGIVTPLSFGFDAIPIWISSFSNEIFMILYSGLLFFCLLPFFLSKKKNILYTALVIAQVLCIIGLSLFPTKSLFYYPIIPFGNYLFYLIPIGIMVGGIIISNSMNKTLINRKFLDESYILILWAGLFILFFMINTAVNYNEKGLFELSYIDFRYLIPAFPAIIILFSKGIYVAISSNVSPVIKKCIILLVSAIIITNIILSFNLSSYYLSSGESHLKGYEEAKNLTENNIIYTQWPFYYENIVNTDIGKYDWKSSNKSPVSIFTKNYIPGSAMLYNDHFFAQDKAPMINRTTITSYSRYLDPLFPYVFEKSADNVTYGKVIELEYIVGSHIFFGHGGNGQYFQNEGWSHSENDFTWTEGYIASLTLPIKYLPNDALLNLDGYIHVNPKYSGQKLIVSINNNKIPKTLFLDGSFRNFNLSIPPGYLKIGDNLITLNLPYAISPKELGTGSDERILGLAVRSLNITSFNN